MTLTPYQKAVRDECAREVCKENAPRLIGITKAVAEALRKASENTNGTR